MAEDINNEISNQSLRSFLKRYLGRNKFETFLSVVIIISVLYIVINFAFLIKSYKHLPGPIYGGDIYRDRGFIQSIVVGFKPWQDGYFLNELQYYNWFGFALLAYPIKILKLNIESTMLWFSFLIYISWIIIYFLIFKEVYKNNTIAYIGSFLVALLFSYPGGKLAELSKFFLILFILFMIKYIKNGKVKYHILASLSLALCGLTYGAIYVSTMVFYTLWIIVELIKLKNKRFWSVMSLLIPFMISILLPLLIFYLPLFLRYGSYHPNPVYKYGDISIKKYSLFYVLKHELKTFFNFNNIFLFILGILGFMGLIFSLISRNKLIIFFKKFYFYNFIAKLHHYITGPIIKKWFFPHKMSLSRFVFPIFIINCLNILKLKISKKSRMVARILIVGFVILLIIYSPIKIDSYREGKWVKYGRIMDDSTKIIYSVGNYLRTHMLNNETVLGNDESSFALMALSGKKVVISRRTHTSYYVDIDKRIADAAVILYGNNSKLRKRLIKKYNIKYFYEDYFLHNYAMNTNVKYRDYLESNGVKCFIKNISIDPAQTIYSGTVMERLIIPPQNISKDFRSIIIPTRRFNIGNKITYSIIYRINESQHRQKET